MWDDLLQKEKGMVEGQTQNRTLTQSQRQRQRVPEVPRGARPLRCCRVLWQAGGEIPKYMCFNTIARHLGRNSQPPPHWLICSASKLHNHN